MVLEEIRGSGGFFDAGAWGMKFGRRWCGNRRVKDLGLITCGHVMPVAGGDRIRYPTKILEKHWPEVHRERDIRRMQRSKP